MTRFRTSRFVRHSVLTLLMLCLSGVVPVAHLSVDGIRGCDDMCARCTCKQRAPIEAMRAPCACCQPKPAVQPVTLLDPMVLSTASAGFALAPVRPPAPGPVITAPAPALSLPDPPPRSSLQS